MTCRSHSHRGFSLVELSIVLVILGLLVGGVLGGRSLIKAAELRAITAEKSNFTLALNNFRIKYNALPGDFNRATDIWGAAASCDGWTGALSADGATCNGDNSQNFATSAADDSISRTDREVITAWQHLSNAGLVEGSYNATFPMENGISRPVSKYDGANWSFLRIGAFIGYFSTHQLTDYLFFNQAIATLTPEEAWNIDQKTDDGRPATGFMMNLSGEAQPDCTANSDGSVTDDDDIQSDYRLSFDGVACSPYFRLQ